MAPHPGYAALRRGRSSDPGRSYLLTFTTAERRPLFGDLWHARAAVRGLVHPNVLGDAHLWCWVLMPDHAHLMLALGTCALPRIVQAGKAASTRNLRELGLTGRVWAPGYHDRAVRHSDEIRRMARYVVANPVRAGLVASVRAWPHWDAAWV